jgi:predicted phosphohydrolase
LFGQAGPSASDAAQGILPLVTVAPPRDTRQEIERVLAKLKADATLSTHLQDFDRVQGTLENALSQLNRIAVDGSLGQSDALLHADDYDLSLVLSAMTSPKEASELGVLFGRDLPGLHQYEDFDPGWIASLWNRLTRTKVPFPVAKSVMDVVYQIPDATSIAIAGDWGTGNASSASIAAQMSKLAPDYTIHLGDVYYSGTESEEQKRFVALWPKGTRGALALNSNHEMYSGGHGYFGIALVHQTFRLQQGYSYFALTNKTWLIIGLDSAYGGSGMYGNGVLNDAQILWLRALMRSDVARTGSGKKNVIVLTHHQGMDIDGSRKDLFSQVTSAIGVSPHRWYWGHVHSVAAFNPIDVAGVQLRCRLTGHGGVPYGPDRLTPALSWTEDQLAGDKNIPARARNGFALLRFTEDGLEERFYDEFGHIRWQE